MNLPTTENRKNRYESSAESATRGSLCSSTWSHPVSAAGSSTKMILCLPEDVVLKIAIHVRSTHHYDIWGLIRRSGVDDVKNMCLVSKSLNDTIKGCISFLNDQGPHKNICRHWKFLERIKKQKPEQLRRALLDRAIDPHIAVIFALKQRLSAFALQRLSLEGDSFDFHLAALGLSLLQTACLYLNVSRSDDAKAFEFITTRTHLKKERDAKGKPSSWFFSFGGMHPLLCAATNIHGDGALKRTQGLYLDRGETVTTGVFPDERHHNCVGDNDISKSMRHIAHEHHQKCVLSEPTADPISSLERVLTLPGASAYGAIHSYNILYSAAVEVNDPVFFECLVRQPWIDLGATNNITFSVGSTVLRKLVKMTCVSATTHRKDVCVLRRKIEAFVRASIVRGDDGAGINDFDSDSEMFLIHMAAAAGDRDVVNTLLAHPLCNPCRICWCSDPTSWLGWKIPVTAASLARLNGHPEIAYVSDEAARLFTERTRMRCLELSQHPTEELDDCCRAHSQKKRRR